MKSLLFIVAVFTFNFCLFFPSCIATGNNETVKGNGKITEKIVESGNIEEIINSGIFNIEVIYGEKQEIKVVTDENILPYFESRSSGKKIEFSNSDKVNLQPTKAVVYITLSVLSKLANAGTGDFTFSGFNNLSKIDISNSGTGDVKSVMVNIIDLNILNSGTGDIELKGKTEKAGIQNTGTGDINSLEMSVSKADIVSTGTGDVKIRVENELNLKLTGTGDFYYSGEPEISHINANGTGEVKKLTQ